MLSRLPAKFEYDLLQYLSQHEEKSVRELFEGFGKPQGYIRGTIVKTMDRMLKKGLVERSLVDGTFIYRTKQPSRDLEFQLVESFVRERLGGRLKPIASYLVEACALDSGEVEQLKQLLAKMEP